MAITTTAHTKQALLGATLTHGVLTAVQKEDVHPHLTPGETDAERQEVIWSQSLYMATAPPHTSKPQSLGNPLVLSMSHMD